MQKTTRPFLIGLISLSFLYLTFELFFNYYSMITVDEFWFAHRIYQYRSGLPYQDFAPYKTVLGYYLLLIPMSITGGILQTLIFTKNTIALLNTFILAGSALWLQRFFNPKAILISLVLLISADITLTYSTQIRVDLLAYWFCFISLLFLLDKRFWYAGLMLGLGFLISQKTIWYLLASNIALGSYFICFMRTRQCLKQIIQFNLIVIGIIAIYLMFWSTLTDWQTVIQSVFYEASAMYQLDWYDQSRFEFWQYILRYNPLLFLLWPITVLCLGITYNTDKNYSQRFFILSYAFTILFCLIPYKQVFPYYMQVTIPIFFILYAAFFSWLLQLFRSKNITFLLPAKYVWAYTVAYTIALTAIIIIFHLPIAYLLLSAIPFALLFYLQRNDASILNIIGISVAFVGLIYPIALFTIKLSTVDGAYQKENIRAINQLLHDGGDYVAGIELIYDKTQPIAGLRHLMGPAVDYLYAPSEKIRPVMLASLYEDPTVTSDSVIKALKHSDVKFYVNNYRMMALPSNIKNYLASQYEHYWGSIYLYAPEVSIPFTIVTIKFSGNYLVEGDDKLQLKINGKKVKPHSMIHLDKKVYISQANETYRLKLIPDKFEFDRRFQKDDSMKLIF